MGEFNYRMPDGTNQVFEVAGDQPTAEEQVKIENYISKTISEDPLEEFLAGFDAGESSLQSSDQFQTPNETPFDPNVDYNTGVKNQLFRLKFSNANTSKEKAMLLNKYGKQGEFWDVDSGGRFVLTPQGYQSLGGEKPLEEGKDRIAIDEETLSWTDVTDFIGEAGLPIAGSIAGTFAGLALAPAAAPLLAAAIGSGLGAGIGSIGDEYQQTVRDVAAEDALSVGKRAGIEMLFGFAGEYAAGTLFNAARRIIKGGPVNTKSPDDVGFFGDIFGGKAATPKQVAAAEDAKQLVKENFVLDLTVENLQNRPILGINVKVFESLFPERMGQNADLLKSQIQDELFEGRDFVKLEEVGDWIKKWETNKLKLGDTYVKEAEKDIGTFLTGVYDGILGKVEEGYDPALALKDLSKVQQAFHTTVDDGFKAIDLDMSSANANLKKIGEDLGLNPEESKLFFNSLSDELGFHSLLGEGRKSGPSFVKPKSFKSTLLDAIDNDVLDINPSANNFNPVLRGILREDQPLEVLSLEQLNVLRSWINTTDAELLLNGKNAAKLFREALDEDIMQASANVKLFQDKLSKDNLVSFKGQIDNAINKYNDALRKTDIDINEDKFLINNAKTRRLIKDQLKLSSKKMSDNMDNVEKLQNSYRDFMAHQDDAFIRQQVKSIQSGGAGPEAISAAVLNNPSLLAKFLTGLRNAQSSKDSLKQIKELSNKSINPEDFTAGEIKLLEDYLPRAAADQSPGNVFGSGATIESLITSQQRLIKRGEAGFEEGVDKIKTIREGEEGFDVLQGNKSKPLADELFKALDAKNNTPGQAILASERDVYNVLKRRQDRIDNNKIFEKRLNETLPELENRAVETLQKSFLKEALKAARGEGDTISVQKFTQFIKDAKIKKSAKPKIDKDPSVNDIDFIREDLANKSVVDMLFPDGQGSDLLDAVNKLNKASSTDDIILNYNTLTALQPTPNAGSKDIKQIVKILEDERKFANEIKPEVQKRMLKEAEGLKDASAGFTVLKGSSPTNQAEYFKAADNQIQRLREAGDNVKAGEFAAYRDKLRDRLLMDVLNTRLAARGSDPIENILDFGNLQRFVADITDSADGVYTPKQLNSIFGWNAVNGTQDNVAEKLIALGKKAEVLSEKGGAKKVRTTGLQTATLGTDIASGEGKRALGGLRKLAKLFGIKTVLQSKTYLNWALTPPKSLAQMNKAKVAIRTALIESLSDIPQEFLNNTKEDIFEASQALEIPEKTKQAKDFAKEQVTSIVKETPISMPTPRRTIPSPEQISMSGPAQQMSANIGNVERDIALGAAGNNPTMQALLRATRGQA